MDCPENVTDPSTGWESGLCPHQRLGLRWGTAIGLQYKRCLKSYTVLFMAY